MEKKLETLDNDIQKHIKSLASVPPLNGMEDIEEKLAAAWIEKENAFNEQLTEMGMIETDSLSGEDENGFLVMTYSGSLLGVGPVIDGKRSAVYVSIGLRKDVPNQATSEDIALNGDIMVKKEVVFSRGPIKQSSPVFRIGVVSSALSLEDQREQVNEATQVLTQDFLDVNNTIIME